LDDTGAAGGAEGVATGQNRAPAGKPLACFPAHAAGRCGRSMLDALPPLVPLPLPEPRRRDVRRRAAATVQTAVRHLRGAALRRLFRRPEPAQDVARALRRTFEALGATYVKLGQLVASAPGVFGDTVADEFRSCLDTGPRVPFAAVRATVERTLGRPLAAAFARFEEIPVGR